MPEPYLTNYTAAAQSGALDAALSPDMTGMTFDTGAAAAPAGRATAGQTGGDPYRDYLIAQNRDTARAYLMDLLTQYGLGALAGDVDSLIQQYNYNTALIAQGLRKTDAYKERFAGLLALQAKGVNDIRNEAEYIQTESAYRQAFRDAGLQDYLGASGSKDELSSIAKLVGDYSVSVNEVRDRINDAQRVVNQTPQEVRDSLQRYYNVSAGDLVAYTLDPARNKDRINQIANAAIAGGYAQQYGLDADLATAESIASLAQGNDLSVQNTVAQMANAREVRDATTRLARIESTDLTDSEILGSEFSTNTDAQRKIKGLQSRERARFSGSSGTGRDTLKSTAGI